jgi:uridylate kinase
MSVDLVNAAVLRWLLGHVDQLPALVAAVESIATAADLADRWAAVKSAGDLVVSILGDFPGFNSTTDTVEVLRANLHQQAARLSIDWSRVAAALPQIVALVEQILALLGAASPTADAA